jgi:AcrR family transcriptional regulator
MEEKKNDRRTEKTRKGIKAALVTYLAQKELSRITVREISETADINRATFYAHYLDVYDLYEKVEQEILMDWSALILRMEDLDHKDFFSAQYLTPHNSAYKISLSPICLNIFIS